MKFGTATHYKFQVQPARVSWAQNCIIKRFDKEVLVTGPKIGVALLAYLKYQNYFFTSVVIILKLTLFRIFSSYIAPYKHVSKNLSSVGKKILYLIFPINRN